MSGESRRLHLRFSMQKPEQRRAYEAISAIPQGRRIDYLCGLINGEAQIQNLEQRVLEAVRQALQEYQPQIQPQIQRSKEEYTAEGIPQDMMEFLGTL